jgi:alpha-L-fucosidase 2
MRESYSRFTHHVSRASRFTFHVIPLFSAIVGIASEPQTPSTLQLWYTQPARQWNEALPIGNGRMGAMVFGRTSDERIQFNEDTLWKGAPHDYVRAGAGDQLAEIRRLLAEGKINEAGQLARGKFLSDPVRQKAYQPFGDLHLHFPGHEDVLDYRRDLDLDSGIASVTYRVDEVAYHREVFASYPDQAIVVRLQADHRGHISFTLKLDSPHTNSQTRLIAADVVSTDVRRRNRQVSSDVRLVTSAATLALTGQVEEAGLRFESRVEVLSYNGQLQTNDNSITVQNADSATLLLVAATSFKNFQDISADPDKRCADNLARVSQRKFETVLADHLADHRALFRRVNLDLGHTAPADLPTDQRLSRLKTSGLESDPALAALHFQYGRYLLIACSRPGSEPANLQGNWNELLDPPWESKYTLNINLEMNYWPAEVCNLTECHEPVFDLIDDLVISGKRTAQKQYGCRGWVVHHNTDLWRGTAPINNIDGIWPTGAAWLCHHLWEHYEFTGDKKFLANRAYPAMKEASLFFMDFLVKDPKTGWLVTFPSYSPEQGPLTAGPTMDEQLVRALMNHTIEASMILGKDRDFAAKLAEVRNRLAPNQIGKHGQLQEWLTDIDTPNNNHRHMSPLWALYPGADINHNKPEVFEAAKVLLQWRGDGSTGWSYAWRIPLWARVGDGDYAFRQLNGLLQKRTLPNLFDLCGPFQIDGNFGAPAGVAEMLLQSHYLEDRGAGAARRIVELLPALPKAWPTGSVSGLRTRGGFEVDLAWDKGVLTRATVRSKLGNSCGLRYGDRTIDLVTKAGKEYVFNGPQLAPAN